MTTLSPALSSVHIVAEIAPMPEATASPASPPSRLASRAFEQRLRRIARAPVDVAGALAAKQFAAGFSGFEGVGRGHENGRRQRAMLLGRVVAMMDGAGRKAEFGVAAGLALVHLVVSGAASGSPCSLREPMASAGR